MNTLRFGLYTTALDRDQTKFYKLLGGDGASFRTRAKTVLRRLADGVPTLRYFRAPGRIHGVHNHDILYARSVGGVRVARIADERAEREGGQHDLFL